MDKVKTQLDVIVPYMYNNIYKIKYLYLRRIIMSIKKMTLRIEEDTHYALKFIALEEDTSLQKMFMEAVEEKYSDRIEEIKDRKK